MSADSLSTRLSSVTSTGTVRPPPARLAYATWIAGRWRSSTYAMPWRSSAQRAFSQKWLIGIVTSRAVTRTTISGDQPLGRVGGALDEVGDVGLRLGEAAEHVAGDDFRVGRVRPADADPHAVEVGAAELALQRLQPVVAGETAAEPRLHLAERQVDLVVQHDDPVEVDAECAAGRARGAARLVHVGLRQQQADARAAGHR